MLSTGFRGFHGIRSAWDVEILSSGILGFPEFLGFGGLGASRYE